MRKVIGISKNVVRLSLSKPICWFSCYIKRLRQAQSDSTSRVFRDALIFISILFSAFAAQAQAIRVGAKHFNEGYILSEIISQLLESEGYTVERKYNLGGTLVCFEALRNNAIDVYPEYSGTLSAEILKQTELSYSQINEQLQNKFQLQISEPYGFNNSYAFVIKKQLSEINNLHTISDLKDHPELNLGLSYEFLKRQDGWDNLAKSYSLPQQPIGLEHGLAYQALDQNKISLTDAYSTDGEIPKYNLLVLQDDRHFFSQYKGTSLYRQKIDDRVKQILSRLNGKINETKMQSMNAAVLYDKKTFAQVASQFLISEALMTQSQTKSTSTINDILQKTGTHLSLTFSALLLAICFSIPLGVWLYWHPAISKSVLNITGLLQTIPSIALLAIMIPLFGIGTLPAIVALFLYAVLPILRNTLTGLQSIDPLLKKVADGIGMNRFQKLKLVEFPLALPIVMAGIRTAAVINVGTATLAAFIGAGGLGEFIVTGLALNNTELILRGAIPAALLALLVEIAFTILEKAWVPKHLR
jgi:osmoprotectant transport system permease protein